MGGTVTRRAEPGTAAAAMVDGRAGGNRPTLAFTVVDRPARQREEGGFVYHKSLRSQLDEGDR